MSEAKRIKPTLDEKQQQNNQITDLENKRKEDLEQILKLKNRVSELENMEYSARLRIERLEKIVDLIGAGIRPGLGVIW
jgi:wobble nucleotide-excising tRNase